MESPSAGGGEIGVGEGEPLGVSPLPAFRGPRVDTGGLDGEEGGGDVERVHVIAVMPPSGDVRSGELAAVAHAVEEATFLTDHAMGESVHEVNVFEDRELGGFEVVELLGKKVGLQFPTRTALPFLVVHLRDLKKWCALEITVVDEENRRKTLVATNRSSLAKLTADTATLPLRLIPERWNRLSLDVEDLTEKAFGVKYKYTAQINIKASCRVARVFFTDAHYEDHQLPSFLRVLP